MLPFCYQCHCKQHYNVGLYFTAVILNCIILWLPILFLSVCSWRCAFPTYWLFLFFKFCYSPCPKNTAFLLVYKLHQFLLLYTKSRNDQFLNLNFRFALWIMFCWKVIHTQSKNKIKKLFAFQQKDWTWMLRKFSFLSELIQFLKNLTVNSADFSLHFYFKTNIF